MYKNKKGQDWAQEVVTEILEICGEHDDATKAFCECFREGDSVEAWVSFSAKAEDEFEIKGGNSLYVFPDGSCYASWECGIAAFGENIHDFEHEWRECSPGEVEADADNENSQ